MAGAGTNPELPGLVLVDVFQSRVVQRHPKMKLESEKCLTCRGSTRLVLFFWEQREPLSTLYRSIQINHLFLRLSTLVNKKEKS